MDDQIIFLRPFNILDAEHFMEWTTSDPALSVISSKEKALNFINDFTSSHPYMRAICLKSNNIAIGCIILTPPKEKEAKCRAAVGYSVGPKYRNKGVATMALRMLVGTIFRDWSNLERVEALVEVDNMASQRVLEKVGFVKEGVLRKYVIMRGKAIDVVMCSFLSSDVLN